MTRTSVSPDTSHTFTYGVENNPNPDILLSSIRKAGYTLESAIGDLADNPLDHEADIVSVFIRKTENDWDVRVADNGSGMDVNRLDEMLRLGSRSQHDPSRDLGFYGVGSTTASLSLGRHLHVLTRTVAGQMLSGATDLDVVIQSNNFVKHLAPASADEVALFELTFTEAGLSVPATGTVVRITHCDLFPYRDEKKAVDEAREYIAETYRYFIDAGKTFVLNGEVVLPFSPLLREHPGTKTLYEDTIEYVFPKGHARYGETEQIGIIVVQLQAHGGENEESLHGINMRNEGFYVLRNRRQIARGETLTIFTRHNDYNRFRCELLFPGTMDEDIGVSFLKSSYRVTMSQSLKDKIAEVTRPFLRMTKKDAQVNVAGSGDDVDHSDAEKIIQRRAPLLRKPPTDQATRDSSSHEHDGAAKPKGTARTQTPVEPRTQRGLADRARFVGAAAGQYAPFFDWSLDGHVMIVRYNTDHPFYARMVLAQRDNPSVVNAVDYLTYSLATAEANAKTDDTYKFIAKMREDMSFNLRQLLTT